MHVHRIFKLIQNDIYMHKKIIMLSSICAVIFLSILSYFNSIEGFAFILYSGGVIITSNAFVNLNTPEKACFFFTLPASQLEKFISKWLLSSCVFMLYSYLIYLLCSIISIKLSGNSFASLQVFNLMILAIFAKYMVLNSVALLGAIYFRRYPLIKTSLCIGVFISVIIAVVFLASYIICPNCMFISILHLFDKISLGAYYFFWILLMPICLVISYQRLSEYEL